jgi:hypothetical protein
MDDATKVPAQKAEPPTTQCRLDSEEWYRTIFQEERGQQASPLLSWLCCLVCHQTSTASKENGINLIGC